MTAIDHRRAGKRAKRRGERGELEVRDLLRQYGWLSAHRNFQSGGQGGGDLADAIPDLHLEVKMVERLSLPAAWRQAVAGARPTDTVVVVHRCNMQPWLATLCLEDLWGLGLPSPVFRVVGERASVRGEMMAFLRDQSVGVVVLVHSVLGVAVATVLFVELLAALGKLAEVRKGFRDCGVGS